MVQEVNTDQNRVPQHIAIIMDGNGRWAKKRGLPRTAGHKVGAETFRKVADHCRKLGVKYLSVYAFSTENWKRSEEEVSAIMGLLSSYLDEALRDMEKNRVRVRFFGDLSRLSPKLRQRCLEAQQRSCAYDVQVNICLNYGGRDEIVRAAMAYAQDCGAGRASANSLTPEQFGEYLFSKGVPDPDLIIRPSGELRLSNFLPWQAAYSEFYFTDVLWPDFDQEELHRAIAAFQGRSRRFGGV